jgi:hypothetical protein
MTNNDDDYDITESDQNVDGDIGVSSGRVGPSGPGQVAPTGVRDTSEMRPDPDADLPPEQSAGGDEVQPEGLEPKADYPSLDPRSGE